jgi:hypothetical protein
MRSEMNHTSPALVADRMPSEAALPVDWRELYDALGERVFRMLHRMTGDGGPRRHVPVTDRLARTHTLSVRHARLEHAAVSGRGGTLGVPNSTHIIVRNAGHEQVLPHPDVLGAIARFLSGADVDDVTAGWPPLRFVPIEGYDPARTHPSVPRG